MTTIRTACPLDCPDGCTLEVVVEDGRLAKVDAAPADVEDPTINPFTQGFICKKVKGHHRRVYSPDRVMTPLVRTGPKGEGRFRSASWDEALDLVASRIGDGPRRRPGHGRPLPLQLVGRRDRRRAARPPPVGCAGGQQGRPHDLRGHHGHGLGDGLRRHARRRPARRRALPAGRGLGSQPFDLEHALPAARPARPEQRRRARWSSTRARTGMAKRADLHLAVRPGTDVVLAMAVGSRAGASQGDRPRVHRRPRRRGRRVPRCLRAVDPRRGGRTSAASPRPRSRPSSTSWSSAAPPTGAPAGAWSATATAGPGCGRCWPCPCSPERSAGSGRACTSTPTTTSTGTTPRCATPCSVSTVRPARPRVARSAVA